MPKISVIVPVYNKGPYLSAALDSLLAQTFEDMEILCIDDGSVDSSPSVLRQYAERDSRVRVMRHDNAGPSVTRNRGIDEARGEYIFFLDADDALVPYAFDHLYNKVKECDLDGVYFEMQLQRGHPNATDERAAKYKYNHSYEETVSGLELMQAYVANSEYIAPAVRALYRRAFLNEINLRFIPGILHEDNAFTFMFLVQARRVTQIREQLYLRFFVDNSIMTSTPSAMNLRGLIVVMEEMLAFLKGKKFDEKSERAIRSVLFPIEYNINKHIRSLPDAELVKLLTVRDFNERIINSRYITGSVRQNRFDAMTSYGEIKVSVIVTAYNAERGVYDCMDSLMCQTLSDIEILCVDCGSTDKTPDILNQYAEKDSRINVLQPCTSSSHARSTALEAARGDYVYFVDASDFLNIDALLIDYTTAREGLFDITVSLMDHFDRRAHEYIPIPLDFTVSPDKQWLNAIDDPDAVIALTTPDLRGKLFSVKLLKACGVCSDLPALMMARKISFSTRKRATYHCASADIKRMPPLSAVLRERFFSTAELLCAQILRADESRKTWDTLCAMLPQQASAPEPVPAFQWTKELSEPTVSIILPTYNVARYIPECIDSLQSQTFTDFEMIFVDDESTDHSVELIQHYAQTDVRIRIIRQKHRSAGAARNLGIQYARGKYMMFLDPDDFYDQEMIASVVKRSEETQAEVCVFGFNRYDDAEKKKKPDTATLKPNLCPAKEVFSGDDPDLQLFRFCYSEPWDKLYLRSFVTANSLEFIDQRNTNDEYFVRMAFALAKRITVLEKYLIYYRFNTTKSLQDTLYLSPLCFYNSSLRLYQSLHDCGMFEILREGFNIKVISGLNRAFAKNAGHYEAFETIFNTFLNGGFEKLGIGKDLPVDIIPRILRPFYACYCGETTLHCADFFLTYRKYTIPEPRPLAVYMKRSQLAIEPATKVKYERAQEEIKALKVKYERAQEEIKALRTSNSFRVGRMVTSPIRALKGILNKLRS